MSAMYDDGYALFKREPNLTVDELVVRINANADATTERMKTEFGDGYDAARRDQFVKELKQRG